MADSILDISTGLSIPLTSFALTFDQAGAIADLCAPIKSVMLRSAPFPKWDKKSLYKSGSALVGPDGLLDEIREKLDSDTYSVKDYAEKMADPIDSVAEYAALGLSKEQRSAKKILAYLTVERETRARAIFMTAANYGTNTAAAASTWDLAASTPLQDVARAIRSIIGMSLRKVIIMGRAVYDVLRFNTQVLSALGRPGGQTDREIASATQVDLARMFGVDAVLVGDLQFNANNDAVAAMDRQFIWSDKSVAVVVAPTAEQLAGETLSFAITFRLVRDQLVNIDFGGMAPTSMMRRWLDQNRGIGGTWMTAGGYSEDIKLVAPDAGFLITSVIP